MEKSVVYDTITVHRVISDSVTLDALANSQKFYSDSFSHILDVVGFVLTIITIIVGVGAYNWWRAKKYGEKMEDSLKKANEKILALENKINEELNKTKENNKKINELKESSEKQREKIQTGFNTVCKGIVETFHVSIINACKENDWYKHFMSLAGFYSILSTISKFGDYERRTLRAIDEFMDKYEDKNIEYKESLGRFFFCFLPFIKHSEEMSMKYSEEEIIRDVYEESKIRYNKLLKIFTYDKVKKSLEDFFEIIEFDNIKSQEKLALAERYRNKL